MRKGIREWEAEKKEGKRIKGEKEKIGTKLL